MLKVGDKIPSFHLEGSFDSKLSDRDLHGKFTAIVIYPANNTPGCDRQLANLEQERPKLEGLNARVLAINHGTVSSHQSYCDNKGFGFPILSDPGKKVIASFGALKEDGEKTQRSVFVFDPDGKTIFAEEGHADLNDVMKAIREHS